MKRWMLTCIIWFASQVASAQSATAPTTCEALTLKATTGDVINYVLENPYSIGYQGYDSRIHSEVMNGRLVVPDLDGADGKKVSVNVRTIQEALIAEQPKRVFKNQSLGECPDVGICSSILDPNIPNAWPITTLTYIFFPTNVKGDNLRCQQVRALYDYLTWVVSSDAAAAVAHSNHFGVIPSELQRYVTDRLSTMKCNGVSVLNITLSGDFPITLRGSGSSLAKGVYDAMNAAYNSREEIYSKQIQVDYAGGGSGVGLQDMLNCRVDYAGSDATSYNDQDILHFLTPCSKDLGLTLVPVLASSVVMFANLAEANISSFLVTRNLISSLFAGEIVCWNDSRLQAVNPGINLPRKPVLRAVRTGTSGTTETFTHAMASFSGGCQYNVFRCSNDPLWPPPKYDPNLYDGPCPCSVRPPVDTSWSTGKIVMVTGSTFGAAILIFIFLGWTYIGIKRKQSDSLWEVRRDELKFAEPIEVLGRGTFGIVLKAEYRGTNVAVKRVIPPRKGRKRDSIFASGDAAFAFRSMDPYSSGGSGLLRPESGTQSGFFRPMSSNSFGSLTRVSSLNKTEEEGIVRRGSDNLVGVTVQALQDCPAGPMTPTGMSSFNSSFSSNRSPPSSGSGGSKAQKLGCSVMKLLMGDKHTQMKHEFIEEMRLLSKLRHPCITTIMGAVVDRHGEPMLVMECMEYGSLYDLLHNDTAVIEGELILPILCDIAQGIRFLHAARPMIIHGDLKAQNVLVDSSFRAKVADFGFTQKKRFGRRTKSTFGTPLWMAPELLRGGQSTPASDVYAFGILLSEVYSRKDPYEGEDIAKVLEEVANVDREVEKRPYIPPAVPKDAASLMKDCWNKHAEARPHFDEIERRLRALDAEEQFDVHGQIQGSLATDRSIRSSRSKLRRSRSNSVSRLLSVDSNEEWENRSNALLYDLFPKHIAEALQEGRKVEPEHKDLVTIFFSDIVGFTTMSCDLAPGKISDMLDRLYSVFDRLSHELGIYKLETIGDAYMAITNLVEEQEHQHALLIARFAIEALYAANSTLIDTEAPEKGYVQIRVGIHSGPIVANVVGTRRPKYTLFGDTVNTASRMESNSLPSKIHCSLRTAKLIEVQAANSNYDWAKEIVLLPRGDIEVKGKGLMKTFWIEGKALGHGLLFDDGPTGEHDLVRTSSANNIIISSPPTPLKQIAPEPEAPELQSDLVLGALQFWNERDKEIDPAGDASNGHDEGEGEKVDVEKGEEQVEEAMERNPAAGERRVNGCAGEEC